MSMFLPEFGIHCLYGQIFVINLVLHVVELLQQVERAVQMVQVDDVQLQALSNIRPIQDGGVQLPLKTKFILEYSIYITQLSSLQQFKKIKFDVTFFVFLNS